MNRKQKGLLALPIIVVVVVGGYTAVLGIAFGFDPPALEFPISEPDRVERLSAYHTPDWGEPGVFHNGIDLVISDDVAIVSPVRGTVVGMSDTINTYAGNTLFDVSISVNWGWEVELVLEPGFLDSANNSLQSSMIDATVGQRVEPGDSLGTLLFSDNYPHLHYMLLSFGSDVCAYNYSTTAAKSTFESIAVRSDSPILYPYESPSFLLSPVVIVPVILGATYVIAVVIVFRRD
ncbi:MAG: M23 family metallopeptidase [Candidatus Thorarchaeota archaeon]